MMGVGIGMRRQQTFLVAIIYTIVAFLLYGNTIDAKFASDFYGWISKIHAQGVEGLANGFGSTSSLYVYHGFVVVMYKLFQLHPWPWFLLMLSLHVANAFLLFQLITKVSKHLQLTNYFLPAVAGGLFFLVSPKQTEPVIWAAALHYLFCTMLVLSVLHLLLKYAETGSTRYHIVGLLIGLVSVYTNEIAQMLPLVLVVCYLFILKGSDKPTFTRFLLTWVIPQLLFGLSFFAVNYLRLGEWIGHYGADVHLKFSIPILVGHALTYLVDYTLFLRHLPYAVIDAFYKALTTPWLTYVIFVVGLALLGWILYRLNRLQPRLRLILFLLGVAILLLGPILNLYYFYLLPGRNDLYGYVAAPFIYAVLAVSICWLPRKLAISLGIIYLTFALVLANWSTNRWEGAGVLRSGLFESYEPYSNQQPILLNIPNSLQGAYAFHHENTFIMSYNADRDTNAPKPWEVAWYNMNRLTDGVEVVQRDSNQVQVTFDHHGSWWWRNGKGARDYESEHYKVDFDEWSHSYLLTFTDTLFKNRTLLYQDGNKWQEFEMK